MNTRTSIMDRRALFSSAAAATLLAASGVSAAGVPRKGGRLRMALSGAGRTDTWRAGTGLFMQVATQGLVFDTLTEIAANGTLRGELASDWQASSDAHIWDITLRPDVLFHDDTPMTSRDVVASLQGLLAGHVTATGRHSVRIALHAPDAGLPFTLSAPAFVIRPAHAMEAGIGTGLYRVKHFAPGQQLLTTRMVDHYKGETVGWFDEVELVSIPAADVRAEALASYLVDAADLRDATLLAGLPDITLLPDEHGVTQAVSQDIAQPAQIGTDRPLDNLRAAERWWFA